MIEKTPMDTELVRTKLLARLHDPAEKALVLLRDPAGHEGGTVRTLIAEVFGEAPQGSIWSLVKKADHWASAADRPQFPREQGGYRFARWSQVNFADRPILRHPLTGDSIDLSAHGNLRDLDLDTLKAGSLEHFRALIHRDEGGAVDAWRTLLALWRFGPEPAISGDATGLGELWRYLPADTRIPDHTIWQHLDLSSAFAGAFAGDRQNRCALLNVAIGPVQPFIAAARTTSDLWAGSHLLARLAWEAMRVVCERIGPDAVLFPQLRGVPQVDLWLLEQGLEPTLFRHESWVENNISDTNPLFSAALPNRFLALVPADQAETIGQAIEDHVRAWIQETAAGVVRELLRIADLPDDPQTPAYQQARDQLAEFPEIYWSVVGWDEVATNAQSAPDPERLADAMRPFYAPQEARPGFLGSTAWSVLQRPIEVTDPETGTPATFYQPNAGVLYPALYELGERVMSGVKATRPFSTQKAHGYRCSLTGEVEWLTHQPDRKDLETPPGQRAAQGTLWSRVAKKRPSWARKGEHLGALAALKRLWPQRFCEELAERLGKERPPRFVVSTHTMALATSLMRAAEEPNPAGSLSDEKIAEIHAAERVALPRRLNARLRRHDQGELLAHLPGWLEQQRESEEGDPGLARKVIRQITGTDPEAYYALLLMDGDRMGAWLAGGEGTTIPYRKAFHPSLAAALDQRFSDHAALQAYLNTPRAVSPARHLAISGALNDFSSTLARWVVETHHNGRILYAGGDDLMAMLPTGDLLSAMRELRHAYSGTHATSAKADDQEWHAGGFTHRRGRLYLSMGAQATASMGAVIAHHQTPLNVAIQELKRAEQRAKNEGARDAFAVTVLKRSGGALRHVGRWSSPIAEIDEMTTLQEFSEALHVTPEASRRAAYNVANWLTDLPEPEAIATSEGVVGYLESVLHHQFCRQKLENEGQPVHSWRLARLASVSPTGTSLASAAEIRQRLSHLVGVAEFLARESRR
ncbi:type III-B CRISPR-associated protein Cas10/Cmr2 [Halorhodospira abdelmalekii]|uniref:type III-B CRISPR-associated protein Cas10/Cmr2 n=1 Tax=Halorhodospira abdelmalekii TaxID=421629 RepID=UPI0019047510|nr:type III-B CRISPR-associated protein Cas10/Cmr2 [Halorhodospira abdelmalekii]MBK1735772.1 type III-B CRISPR-associated protein Cas10/Cmr2 [Halorhodospira abdelmalekii]